MKIVPGLTVTRFAQLAAGDLFLARLGSDDSCVAIVAEDPARNGQKYFVPLGPAFPSGAGGPILLSAPEMTVVSFGKNYILRLPVSAQGWSASPPPPGTIVILVTDSGCYFRADAASSPGLLFGFVDIATGRINTSGQGAFQRHVPPAGITVFALEWEIVTDEPEPRPILAYPFT